MNSEPNTVILFSAPSVEDAYYQELFDEITDFYNRFIENHHPKDLPLIIVGEETLPIVEEIIPPEYAIAAFIPDIWIRDFAPIVTPKGLFKFKYKPNYIPQKHANKVDKSIRNFCEELDLPVENLPLILDGGNLVFNGKDKAVITERIFADNSQYATGNIVENFKEILGVEVAIIPEEEGDVTGHSDGMVKWLSEDKLAVSRYEDSSFIDSIVDEIMGAFSAVDVVEMPFEPTGKSYEGFFDATGIYVNALTTPNAIYIPVYDLAADEEAIAIFENYGDREIIPIYMGRVALLGGSLNCLSWSISGENAEKIINS